MPDLTLTTADAVAEMPEDAPRDCVRELASLSSGHVLLVTYDWQGVARYRDEIPAIEDLERWSAFLLKRCRRFFPRPLQLID